MKIMFSTLNKFKYGDLYWDFILGQQVDLKNIIMYSAIASFIFGAGFLIIEADAGGAICNGKAATHTGTPGNDRIIGTNGDDVIVTFGGNDVIFAKRGNDTICSGDGRDAVFAGRGNDWVDPGSDRDLVVASRGNDMIFAQDGEKDSIYCGPGNDFAQVDERERRISRCETVEEPYNING